MLVCALLCVCVSAALAQQPLPPYLKPCFRNKPDFTECAKESAKTVINGIVDGDRKYSIPSFRPLLIERVFMENGQGEGALAITLTQLRVMGLDHVELRDFRLDETNKNISMELAVPVFEVASQYEVSGKILLLPIRGSGPANITMVGLTIQYSLQYDVNPDGHMILQQHNLWFQQDDAHILFDNLFDGDPTLNQQMRVFFRENWREVLQELGPGLRDAVAQVIRSILTGVLRHFTFDQLFPLA